MIHRKKGSGIAATLERRIEQNVAGIIITRPDGTIAYVNPYFAGLGGYTRQEMIGQSAFEFMPEAQRPSVAKALRQHHAFVHGATSLCTKDGGGDLLFNASPAVFEGQPGSIVVMLDVRILILEDVPSGAELADRAVRRAGLSFRARRVETREASVEALEHFAPQIILADYRRR